MTSYQACYCFQSVQLVHQNLFLLEFPKCQTSSLCWFPSSSLGTSAFQTLACRVEAGASKTAFPSRSSHRYTQVLKRRHSGRDCRNPVHRDVKLRATNYQNQTLAQQRVCPPWLLDSGNPCRNDGIFVLVPKLQLGNHCFSSSSLSC